MKVLALTKYGPLAASTRQRFMQYRPVLAANDISVDFSPFFDDAHVAGLVAGRPASALAALRGYMRRLRGLITARGYDALWVHYELFPYLPGPFEQLAQLAGRPIILDYDDATFHIYDSSPNGLIRRMLGRKLEPLLKRARACCCGNEYLRAYAAQFCPQTVVLPTVVDTEVYRPVSRAANGPVVIGWIGSPSTWRFVRPLLPVLRGLVDEFGVVIRAVGAGVAAESDQFPGLELVTWNEASEVDAVQSMDIGIMPVPDGPFERGKCGYKLIQYMACGVPVVASPIGVNREIVVAEVNGFLADSDAEWRSALVQLIENADLRSRLGTNGRDSAVMNYSLASQAPRLIEVFKSLGEVR